MNWKLAPVLAALATAAAGTASAEVELVANCHAAPTHVICAKILPTWIESVEKITEGRVTVRQLASSGAPPPEQLASVQAGIFDMASSQFNGFIADQVVGSLVSLQPFTTTSDATANSIALWRTWEKFFSGVDEYEDVHLLGLFSVAGADFYSMTDQPIQSTGDLQRRMWAVAGVPVDIVSGFGAATISGPAVQMTELIQRGVVDGFTGIPTADVVELSLQRYVKSVTRTKRKIFAPSFSTFVSDAAWDRISPEDQALIMSVSGEAFAAMAGGFYAESEANAIARLDADIAVYEASPEFEAALEAAGAAYSEKWIARAAEKGFDGKAALEFYKATAAELAAK